MEQLTGVTNTGLRYPHLGVTFIQTFTIPHTMLFDSQKAKTSLKEKSNIGDQIFVLPPQQQEKVIDSYGLATFDFEMDIRPKDNGRERKDKWADEIEERRLSGTVHVDMQLFFGNTVSVAYNFLFDGKRCRISSLEPHETSGKDSYMTTDHLIILLSTWLGAEFWNGESIVYDVAIRLKNPETGMLEKACAKDFFEKKAEEYKKTVLGLCNHKKGINKHESESRDFRYAFVDIWEDLQHIGTDGLDSFDEDHATESEIISHIREHHKEELVGLMTLYPEEWKYRSPEAYRDVCGEDIAIDTDDLVLAGSNVCLVFGTYGRRADCSYGVDWKKHLETTRKEYGVSWPEYLLIMQMVLAKKQVLEYACDQLVESMSNTRENNDNNEIIKKNSHLSLRLTRKLLLLDVVKYARFPSHKVMYERTMKRFGISDEEARLERLIDAVDSSFQNISAYESMRSDSNLNLILGLISIVSAFELFFQNTDMPFLYSLFRMDYASNEKASAWVIVIAVAIAIYALLTFFVRETVKIYKRLKWIYADKKSRNK